jgi:hypothetical protein
VTTPTATEARVRRTRRAVRASPAADGGSPSER